jgi:hypothetical protein
MKFPLLTFVVQAALLRACVAQRVEAKKSPGLWLWLSGQTDAAVEQIKSHSRIVTHVSYGGYSVSPSATFTGKTDKNMSDALRKLRVERWPLIGGGSTTVLRALFKRPDAFITAAVKEIQKEGFDGYNIDFEPYDHKGTNNDGLEFGIFLGKFANALHAVGKKLSVDYFSNLPVWNLGAMNSSSTDYFISMDTYVPGNATFEAYLNIARAKLNGARLGVGMCTGLRPSPFTPYGPDPCGLTNWTDADLVERFQYLDKLWSTEEEQPFAMLNLWVLPLAENWWGILETYFGKWRR